MALTKRPRTSVADLRFLREMVEDAREVLNLRGMLNRRITALRRKLVKRIADAAYTRYKRNTSKQDHRPSFVTYLHNKMMEDTYLHHQFETIQYWASRPILIARAPQLNFGIPELDDNWYYELLEEYLNLKEPHGLFWIVVTPDTTESVTYPNNPTVLFTKVATTILEEIT